MNIYYYLIGNYNMNTPYSHTAIYVWACPYIDGVPNIKLKVQGRCTLLLHDRYHVSYGTCTPILYWYSTNTRLVQY